MIENCIFLQVLWESWILDFAKNAFRMHSSPNLRGQDSRFKIQGSEKTFWIQGGRIQDSRFKAQKSWILNPTSLDSRSFFWALNLGSWILPPWIQKGFSEPWILNLGSWILPPWIQEFFFGILNLESYLLGFNKFCLSLESWILRIQILIILVTRNCSFLQMIGLLAKDIPQMNLLTL